MSSPLSIKVGRGGPAGPGLEVVVEALPYTARNTSLCLEILASAFLWHTKEYAKNYFYVFRMTFLENIYFFTHKSH